MQQKPVRVLMIEDDDEDYLIASKLLAKTGGGAFALERGASLQAGLAAITLETEAVLLDLSLPDSHGWETFERVRQYAPHLPVILLTGLDDETLGRQAVHGGAQDYLVKGQFDARLLARAILYAIERKTAEERLEHLAEELGAANRSMALDLAMAREVQQALMPGHIPPLPDGGVVAARLGMLYHPSRSLGGDFYSVLPVSPSEVGLLVCDVVGHGVRSALVTAVLRGLVEEARPAARDPGRVLTQINRAFVQVLALPEPVLFATAVYVFADLARGVVRGANAGHPPALRLTAGRDAAWIAFHGGAPQPALGLDGAVTYATGECALAPGDRILLYTDGIPEARDAGGEEYGRARLLAAAAAAMGTPAEQVPGRILRDVQQFAGREEFEDDLCLVILEHGRGLAAERSA